MLIPGPTIGFVTDLLKSRLHLPRSSVIPLIALGFLASQLALLYRVDRVDDLWMGSMMVGASYGTVFVVFPNVIIELFGIGELSFFSLRVVLLNLKQLTSAKTGATCRCPPF